MPERIVVDGLDELRRALKELGDVEASREFKQAGKTVVAKIIPKAQGKASGLGAMQGRAGASLKPAVTATGAAVRFGGGVPWAMGSEFGSGRNTRRNTRGGTKLGWNQFRPWRGSGGNAGYFLWPTVREEARTIAQDYNDLLKPLYERLGWH